ncbi:MAG: RecX family transcriptional regulator, partial [Chloroflexota bacterium]|nr:RecX family transcriptional regulator [Chloroflexota bacterium]
MNVDVGFALLLATAAGLCTAIGGVIAIFMCRPQRYAESWIRTRLDRGDGPRRLRYALAQVGLDESLIEQALP